ncbi:MAG: DUF4388 domain-containing protein [Thermoanaerobaculia bacterium]|nr:DUF4388 domain-containing protein [Thermoanaerobaculia bacterium]
MPETDSAKPYQYRGDLAETALPEMLFTIYMHRVPGVIEARQGEILKRVFVRDGAVIHASSSDLDDSLGSFLRQEGRLTEVQFANTMKARETSDKRYGEVLIQEDVLTPAELYEAIQDQIRSIVWSLFGWNEGEVTFSIGAFEETNIIRIHLPLRQVILEGIKRAPDAKALVARLGRKETVFQPTWSPETLIEAALNREELELLRMVDGDRSLYELCTKGPHSPAENARLLYAFFILRLIRRADGSSGVLKIKFRPE